MTEPQRGTRIVCTDLATGATEETVIVDDVCVIVDGTAYVSNVADYRSSGTQVYTIKGRGGR